MTHSGDDEGVVLLYFSPICLGARRSASGCLLIRHTWRNQTQGSIVEIGRTPASRVE